MDTQIISGEYAGKDKSDYYRAKEHILKVNTEYGTMWVTLVGDVRKRTFDPESERVMVVLSNPDQGFTYPYTEDPKSKSEVINATSYAVGFIVQRPIQEIVGPLPDPDEEVNAPTKILAGSNSQSDNTISLGQKDTKLIITEDMIALKGPGGQILIGNDGIIIDGKLIAMKFFDESKAGLLKENWIANIIPTTVVTPFPMYEPDTATLDKIKGLLDIARGLS